MLSLCALSCKDVSKIFPVYDEGNVWRLILGKTPNKIFTALDDISLVVPKGKFVGVLGHNGAGKSTLLRTLAGVYSPTSGQIKINGNISALFELGGFGGRYLTGREYAKRILGWQSIPASSLNKYIEEIYAFSELKESFDQRIHTYSTGMVARLYFATATALQHDIYLIDEILSVGDEHFQAKCWQRLRERFAHGASGVLVTHDWSAVLKLCEEAYILEHGRIKQFGCTDKIIASYLNLPLPKREIACFLKSNSEKYIVHSRKDAEFLFDIQLKEDTPVEFGYSIELLRIGIGWEILLLQDCKPLVEKAGKYTISLRIPNFPLSPGQYSLNLFLNSPLSTVSNTRISYDIKSWTIGNHLELIVEGKSHDTASTVLPVSWKKSRLTQCGLELV